MEARLAATRRRRHSVAVAITVAVALSSVAIAAAAAALPAASRTSTADLRVSSALRGERTKSDPPAGVGRLWSAFRSPPPTTTTTTSRAPLLLSTDDKAAEHGRRVGPGFSFGSGPGASAAPRPAQSASAAAAVLRPAAAQPAAVPETTSQKSLETTTQDRFIISAPLQQCPEGQRMSPDRKCVENYTDPED